MSGVLYRVTQDQQLPEMAGTQDVPRGQYLERLREAKINISTLTDDEIVFDLIGVDASLANALRRILLAELPTVAIEHVFMTQNSGILQDEILAHRVGLVPIRVDPRLLDYVVEGEEGTDADTLTFHLNVYYLQNDEEEPLQGVDVSIDGKVLSKHLKWLPQGGQAEKFIGGVEPVNGDILLAQLRPGQRIEFEAHCRKGIGKDHAKFSPVATASYRLLPVIELTKPLEGALAKELVDMCPLKVFDIEDVAQGGRAVVARPRDCTMCRECVRREGWADRVKLMRKSDHFIFTVESTGSLPPYELVREALGVLKGKAAKFTAIVEKEQEQESLAYEE